MKFLSRLQLQFKDQPSITLITNTIKQTTAFSLRYTFFNNFLKVLAKENDTQGIWCKFKPKIVINIRKQINCNLQNQIKYYLNYVSTNLIFKKIFFTCINFCSTSVTCYARVDLCLTCLSLCQLDLLLCYFCSIPVGFVGVDF